MKSCPVKITNVCITDDETSVPRNHRIGGPRKSLVFPTPDKPEKKNTENPGNKTNVTKGFKRQIEELYALLSDGEESDNELHNDTEGANPQPSSNKAKRARISSPEQNVRTADHSNHSRNVSPVVNSLPQRTAIRTHKVLTRPPISNESISLTGSDGGRRVYLHLNKDESLESGKVGNDKRVVPAQKLTS